MAKSKACWILLGALTYSNAQSELQSLDDTALSATAARAGITVDIDLSGVEFVYNYKNNQNTNEEFWISGAETGGELVQINGITLDVVDAPGISGGAIAIGAPSEIKLSNVKTGDYYIARNNASDSSSPPKTTDIISSDNRKLFGLSWNSNIGIDFPEAGAALVESQTFENKPFQSAGHLLIFSD